MSGKPEMLAVDDSGVGQTQPEDQRQLAEQPGGQHPVVARPAEGETPPEHKSLMAAIDRHLTRGFDKQTESISDLKHFTTDGFNQLNDNLSAMGERVERVESKVIGLNKDQIKLTETLLDTRKFVNKNIVRLTALESDKNATKTSIDSMQKQIDDLSEKMISITDVIEQVRSGRLGTFTDLEAPTLKDQFDMKVAFIKRKNGIGFFPIYQEHLDALMSTNNVSEVDAYRVAVSQFLQLEMAFEESFVVNLEAHYVEIQYNMIDTVYIVVDDLELSGAKRIWQESQQLRRRQTGDLDRDPRLINMDFPQFRERIAAMKKYATHCRWEWRRANEADFDAGARYQTRVVEAIDHNTGTEIYDFVVQGKPPGGEFQRLDWPATRPLPKIEWKNKTYKHHKEFFMKVRRDQQVRRDYVPPGRPTIQREVNTNQERWTFTPKVHTYRPQHQYIPGVVDPSQEGGDSRSLNDAGGITPWMAETIASGRTPTSEVNEDGSGSGAGGGSGAAPQTSATPGAGALTTPSTSTAPGSEVNDGGTNEAGLEAGITDYHRQARRRELEHEAEQQRLRDEEYAREVALIQERENARKAEEERKLKEKKEREEQFKKHVEERAKRENRSVEEILAEWEAEEKRVEEERIKKDKEKADKLRALGGVSFGFLGRSEFHSSSMMEESNLEKSEEELDKEMLDLQKQTEKQELARWKKDEEDRAEKERIEAELRQEQDRIKADQRARVERERKNNPSPSHPLPLLTDPSSPILPLLSLVLASPPPPLTSLCPGAGCCCCWWWWCALFL